MPLGLPVAPPTASSAAPPAWTTLLDFDFTLAPTQALGVDGVTSFGGLNWTRVNAGSDQVAMGNTNGTGLLITPNGDANPAGFAAPFLWLPMAILAGATPVDFATRFRIYLSIGAEVGDTVSPVGSIVGMATNPGPSGGGTVDNGLWAKRGWTAAGQGTQVLWAKHNGQWGNDTDNSYVLSAANRTTCLESQALGGVSVWARHYRAAQLAAGAPFPALSTFLPDWVGAFNNTAPVVHFGNTTSLSSDLGLMVGACAQGAQGFSTIIQRVRVDVRN